MVEITIRAEYNMMRVCVQLTLRYFSQLLWMDCKICEPMRCEHYTFKEGNLYRELYSEAPISPLVSIQM